jgi:hypothetical protein
VAFVAVEVGQGDVETGGLGTVATTPTAPVSGWDGSMANATRTAAENGNEPFVAAGNGITSTGVGLDRCTTYSSEVTGPLG